MHMNRLDAASQGAAGARWASRLVVVVLCLMLVVKVALGPGQSGQVPFVVALFVLPLLYVVPATRSWWTARRWWLLAAQAVLTCVPFAVFGSGWTVGLSGLLAGLVLLTVAAPFSWLLFAALIAAELAIRLALVGPPVGDGASAGVAVAAIFVDDALLLFGLARLADLVTQVHAARGELAELAISRERLRTAKALRSAIGVRLTAVSGRAEAALQAASGNPPRARELITEAGGLARQALADARTSASYRAPDPADDRAGIGTGPTVAPRLALTVLVALLCGFTAETVNNVLAAHLGPVVTAAAVVDGLAIVALQLHHSRPSPDGSRPWAWPWTLALQALLLYCMLPALGWIALSYAGFLAGSALLLIPGRRAWAAFAAVVASTAVLLAIWPYPGLTPGQELSFGTYLTLGTALTGLTVYGLSRLAVLAVQLEALRGELAAAAVAQERLRLARDTHDLLGLGLTAAALKADLIVRLIGHDDARAQAEIAELCRISAAASSDIRMVTGQGQRLSLAGELSLARELLVSAGIDLRADLTRAPLPASADTVMAPVLREAVTNILRHSAATNCMIETAAAAGVLRLRVSNDGALSRAAGDGSPGHGLANLTARVEAGGGRLTSRQAGGQFDLIAEIPLLAPHHEDAGDSSGRDTTARSG